jgi:hypothetical protein
MKVRYSYLRQQFSNCPDLWIKLKKFVRTGDFTLGKPLKDFEKKFARLMKVKYAIGVNSGTDAIKLSLKVLGVKSGDEVIKAANTFVATVGAITELGAIPVFVDCDETFCINTNLVEKKITKIIQEKTDIFKFEFNELTLTDEETQSKIDERYLRMKVIVPNDVRPRLGLSSLQDGDIPVQLTAQQSAEATAQATGNRLRDQERQSNSSDNNGTGRATMGDGRAQQ